MDDHRGDTTPGEGIDMREIVLDTETTGLATSEGHRIIEIGAIELVKEKSPREPYPASEGIGAYCTAACADAGLVVRNMGDSIAFCPPLIITSEQIDEMFSKFAQGLDATWAAYKDK